MTIRHSPTQRLGYKGESLAQTFLKKKGLKLITRNYFTPFGEIDLIMEDKRNLIFIEVRCRHKNTFMTAADSINFKKQRKILKSVEYYLQRHPTKKACRLDIVAIQLHPTGEEIEWIINAF